MCVFGKQESTWKWTGCENGGSYNLVPSKMRIILKLHVCTTVKPFRRLWVAFYAFGSMFAVAKKYMMLFAIFPLSIAAFKRNWFCKNHMHRMTEWVYVFIVEKIRRFFPHPSVSSEVNWDSCGRAPTLYIESFCWLNEIRSFGEPKIQNVSIDSERRWWRC